MTPSEHFDAALFAGAEKEAEWDGRTLRALSKTDQKRYVDRFAAGLAVYEMIKDKTSRFMLDYYHEDGSVSTMEGKGTKEEACCMAKTALAGFKSGQIDVWWNDMFCASFAYCTTNKTVVKDP